MSQAPISRITVTTTNAELQQVIAQLNQIIAAIAARLAAAGV